MTCVDGFVPAVPAARKADDLRHAERTAPILRGHGALSMIECRGEDVPEGRLTSFPMAVTCAADETVVFAWVTWPSKQARDEGWQRIVADPRMKMAPAAMPFDGRRMIFGGFGAILEA